MPKRSASSQGASKVPKAVKAVRDCLRGKEITGQSLKDEVPPKIYEALTSAFRSVMSGDQKETYRRLACDKERRDFMVQFVLDPQEFKGSAKNICSTINQKADRERGQWLMESQLAGPKFMHDKNLAKLLCESGELESRPNEYKCFRDMKIPQYYFTEAMLEKLTGSKEEASVEVTASVTKDEYEEVKDAMLDSKGLPAQKKKACAAKKNNLKETPEQKALKEVVANKGGFRVFEKEGHNSQT